jgi:hypothetical protein
VESTLRTKPRPCSSHMGSIIAPSFILIPITMAVAFTVLIIGARVLGASLPLPPDPFEAYADLFPGQPRSAAVASGFSCPASFFNPGAVPLPIETCVFWPVTGPFSQIIVSVSQDEIRQLRFILRGTALKMPDLIAWWGAPLIEDVGEVRQYHWTVRGTHASVIVLTGRHSPMSLLHSVSLLIETVNQIQRITIWNCSSLRQSGFSRCARG